MTLRIQVASLLAVLTVVLVMTTYGVHAKVILPAFARLEEEAALADIHRCKAAIEREVELLSLFCFDWSAWDDVYQFAQDKNESFIQSNLKENAFEISHVNLICILNAEHQIVWGGFRNMETLEPLEPGQLFELLTCPQPALNQFSSLEDKHEGLLSTVQGPLLIAARPITTSLIEGPCRGTMIFGRLLDDKAVADLRRRTGIDLAVWDLASTELPSELMATVAEASAQPSTRVVSDHTLEALSVMTNIFNQPQLLVQAKLPRPVMAQGRVASRIAASSTAVGGVITMLVLAFVLRWRITKPLQEMASHAVRLSTQSSLTARLDFSRTDEIGVLAKEFDTMVANLDQSRKQLTASAHQAGMAEIASEMLHNIGNAVNSVNCSASQLEQRLNGSKLSGLSRSASLLREQLHAQNISTFFGTDPRGPKLVKYLIDLSEVMEQERNQNQQEVVRLQETARHIAEIIAAQQSYARRSDFRHEVNLNELIEDVLTINQEMMRAAEIQVAVHVPELPELLLNKSKLSQVLVNLVRNSLQAMQSTPSDQRRLVLKCQLVNDSDLEIEISDSGIGFDQATQNKLFTHGFTTKPTGNGLGLHYCANAVRELGGHIAAHSAGLGQGATFRIRIPNILNSSFSASSVSVSLEKHQIAT